MNDAKPWTTSEWADCEDPADAVTPDGNYMNPVHVARTIATCRQRDELVEMLEAARRTLSYVAESIPEHEYQELASALEAPPRFPDADIRRQRDELVAVVRELVEALDMTVHDDGCGRTDECDDERGHDCGHHGRVCPSCVCGVGRWQAATTKARDVLAKWSGK